VGIALLILGLLVFAVIAVLVTARQRSTTGRLSRETRKSDRSEVAAASDAEPADEEAVEEETAEGRARADEARRAIESGTKVGEVVPAADKTPVVYVPVDEEELGVTRRQFFNRSILAGSGIGLGAFGIASLAFLWPSSGAGSQTKVVVGSEADAKAAFDSKIPFYNAGAKVYIVAYPKSALPKAKKVTAYKNVLPGMEQGYVALYQKCVHLGCRVPWCESSQWFECPCHGSKYNRVGEKRGGPAPRGLDRYPLQVSGGNIVVDLANLQIGPPIGTDTTGQSPEGAPCV
jgi:cytochrome b6-f complex iron-sulfur subunit